MITQKLLQLIVSGIIIFNIIVSFPIKSEHISESSSIESKGFDFDNCFFDDEDDNDIFINEFLDTVGTNQISKVIDPELVQTLLTEIDAINILKEDFFLRTNPLNKRSLLDEPLFEPSRAVYDHDSVFGAHLFFRETERSNFDEKSTNISSYLALAQPSLIERLQNTIGLAGIDNIDIPKIFSLFENMTVQDRRTGLMFHYMKKSKDSTFRLLFPFYYLESNFFLTDDEQEAVAQEFGELEKEEQDAFQKAHFISDKIGIGDTRIEFDHKVLDHRFYSFRFGGLATIPTAFAWGKGFMGSSFPEPSTLPLFDFDEIFCLAENLDENQDQIFNILSNALLDALDRLAANLIDTKLGNDGHFGLGTYLRGKAKFRPWLTFTNRISIEYLFPATDKRFFINKINEEEFNKRDFTDDSKAAENITFLEEKLVERLFLRAFDTRIRPGVIFRWTSFIRYKGDRFGFNLGSDLWLQDKEKVRSIKTSAQNFAEIDVNKAKPPFARQSKIFAGLVFRKKRYNNTWYISLNGHSTFGRKGIGEDFGLSLNFETNF